MKLKFRYLSLACICCIFILTFFIINHQPLEKEELTVPWKCSDLFYENFNQSILNSAKKWKYSQNETLSDQEFYEMIKKNCKHFVRSRKYFTEYFSNEENESSFRIAFTIIAYKSGSQIERLFRAIYRPWNYYCIHLDVKAKLEFVFAIRGLIDCLNKKYGNIINMKKRVNVIWGEMSVLQADLNCMKELYEKFKDWKYLINLTGQEYPLKTNAELVKILKAYDGANNIDATYEHRRENRIPLVKMPFPVVWFKGSTHITANREFIKFIFESPKSKIILEALKDAYIPDESFYNTLNYNPQLRIPGSFIGNPDDFVPKNNTRLHFLTRYKNWGEYSCKSGKIVREICIWGVEDLPKLVRAPHLFSNKFYEDFQPATLKCLEEWYNDKVEREMTTGLVLINKTFYSNLPFVLNQFRI